jgi:flagellar biosynthesis/type III secretory pathway chaperone
MKKRAPKENLKKTLQLEISLMRELLSNLREEEVALMSSDLKDWGQVMARRSDMVLSLQELRIERRAVTGQVLEEGEGPLDIPLEKLISPDDEDSCELASLLDQLLALIERLNLQNSRNDQLFDQTKHLETPPLYCTYPHPNFQPLTARRRPGVKTKTEKK